MTFIKTTIPDDLHLKVKHAALESGLTVSETYSRVLSGFISTHTVEQITVYVSDNPNLILRSEHNGGPVAKG